MLGQGTGGHNVDAPGIGPHEQFLDENACHDGYGGIPHRLCLDDAYWAFESYAVGLGVFLISSSLSMHILWVIYPLVFLIFTAMNEAAKSGFTSITKYMFTKFYFNYTFL